MQKILVQLTGKSETWKRLFSSRVQRYIRQFGNFNVYSVTSNDIWYILKQRLCEARNPKRLIENPTKKFKRILLNDYKNLLGEELSKQTMDIVLSRAKLLLEIDDNELANIIEDTTVYAFQRFVSIMRQIPNPNTLYEATTLVKKLNNLKGNCLVIHTDYWYNEDRIEPYFPHIDKSVAYYIRKPGVFLGKDENLVQWKPAEYDFTIDVRNNRYFVPGVKTLLKQLLS